MHHHHRSWERKREKKRKRKKGVDGREYLSKEDAERDVRNQKLYLLNGEIVKEKRERLKNRGKRSWNEKEP